MKVQTLQFGEIEVPKTSIITFKKGILGFDEYKKYALIPVDEKGETPFFILQCVEQKEISLFLLDTFAFFKGYHIELQDQYVEKLELEKPEDAIILTTVTVKDQLINATTNLKAPIVINLSKQLGVQVVLDKTDYKIKQPLFRNNEKATVGEV